MEKGKKFHSVNAAQNIIRSLLSTAKIKAAELHKDNKTQDAIQHLNQAKVSAHQLILEATNQFFPKALGNHPFKNPLKSLENQITYYQNHLEQAPKAPEEAQSSVGYLTRLSAWFFTPSTPKQAIEEPGSAHKP